MKFIGRGFLPLLFLFIALCTTNEIRERILVHRAGTLLKDMHALHLRQSNWNDAQALMTRWGRWGHYDGTCSSQDCMYVITLHDLTAEGGSIVEWSPRITYLLPGFRLLPRQWGGGLRVLQAMFLVQDGLVVRSGIQIDMTQSPYAKGAQPVCCGAELIISAHNEASLMFPTGWEERRRFHPDYDTWRAGGCTFCLMGRLTYADSMSSNEAAKLSDFQLSCATRWSSCLTLEELDPQVQAWYQQDQPAIPTGCAIPTYALARDAKQIVLVEVLEDGVESPNGLDNPGRQSSHVRITATLKGTSNWQIGSTRKIISLGMPFDDKFRPPTPLVKAHKYFLFSGRENVSVRDDPDDVTFEICEIVEKARTLTEKSNVAFSWTII